MKKEKEIRVMLSHLMAQRVDFSKGINPNKRHPNLLKVEAAIKMVEWVLK